MLIQDTNVIHYVIHDYIEKYDALQISWWIESPTPLLYELPNSLNAIDTQDIITSFSKKLLESLLQSVPHIV
jgi:hypothetical protein